MLAEIAGNSESLQPQRRDHKKEGGLSSPKRKKLPKLCLNGEASEGSTLPSDSGGLVLGLEMIYEII